MNTVALMAWRISGSDPDQWPVVVVNDLLEWREFDGGMGEFLESVVASQEPVGIGYVPLNSESLEYLTFTEPKAYVPVLEPFASWTSVATTLTDSGDRTERIARALSIPLRQHPSDWSTTTVALGHDIPADYRHLVDAIGAGQYGSVHVVGPDRLTWLRDKVHAHATGRRRLGTSTAVHPVWPEDGGAIPWAEAVHGWVIMWIPTDRDPNKWPVVAIDPGWMTARPQQINATELLLRYIENSLQFRLWTDDNPRLFRPASGS